MYLMNDDRDSKCIPYTMTMTSNASNEQWPWQKMYFMYNDHDS